MASIVAVDQETIVQLTGYQVSQTLVDTLTTLANTIIDGCYGDTLDQELTDNLGIFLVAHFTSGVFGSVKTERIGPTYVSYDSVSLQDVTGNPLSGTRWGQAVMMLDPTGCISNAHKLRATLTTFTEYTE